MQAPFSSDKQTDITNDEMEKKKKQTTTDNALTMKWKKNILQLWGCWKCSCRTTITTTAKHKIKKNAYFNSTIQNCKIFNANEKELKKSWSYLCEAVGGPGLSLPIIGGSCHKYHFCRDKRLFVATKDVFCRDKSKLVATNVFCRDKNGTCGTK